MRDFVNGAFAKLQNIEKYSLPENCQSTDKFLFIFPSGSVLFSPHSIIVLLLTDNN